MKKPVLFVLFVFFGLLIYSQDVERDHVILEIATGTWCQWCPGAAGSADQLVEEGKDLAVIENHNSDAFDNVYSNYRNDTYYNVGGYPTAKFDGIVEHVGGGMCPPPWNSVYNSYLQKYNTRKAINSPFTLEIYGEHSGGEDYEVTILIEKVGTATTTNTVVQLVITESHIQQSWQGCMTECNFVNRLMVPNQFGTPLNLNANNQQEINLEFSLDPAWDEDNIEVVCFIQNNTSKEVYQGTLKTLEELAPPPLVADFSADDTDICEATTVQYTDESIGNPAAWAWTFPGGTPATSTLQNPTVVYNTAGSYDVTLKVFRGGDNNTTTKPSYITVSAEAPGTPVPEGEVQLCKNPLNTPYTATGTPTATSYDWTLDPSTCGQIIGDGNKDIQINFVNAYVGSANLTVKAMNGCGESAVSEPLAVTISPRPAVFNVTGGGSFCEGGEGVEIGLDNSEVDVMYQLVSLEHTFGDPIAGTGGPISFGMIADTGVFSVVGTSQITTCDITMTNTVSISMVLKPTAYNITGGGAYCEGTEGAVIGLDGSAPECNYELFCNDVSTGLIVSGTGGTIEFEPVTTLGIYHIQATESQLSCTDIMNGTTEVTMDYLPLIPVAPEGPLSVDLFYNDVTEYTTIGSEFSTSYQWNIEPANAGTVEIIGLTTCQVNWNINFLGEAALRVQGVNNCGESDWSEAVVVTVYNTVGFDKPGNSAGLKVSPNPSDGIFSIQLTSKNEEVVSLRVVSSINTIAFEETNIRVSGSYTKTIDLSQLPDGVYFLYVETSGTTYIRKLVIQ